LNFSRSLFFSRSSAKFSKIHGFGIP